MGWKWSFKAAFGKSMFMFYNFNLLINFDFICLDFYNNIIWYYSLLYWSTICKCDKTKKHHNTFNSNFTGHYTVPRHLMNSFLFLKFIKKRYYILLIYDWLGPMWQKYWTVLHLTWCAMRNLFTGHSNSATLFTCFVTQSYSVVYFQTVFATQKPMCIWLTRCNLTQFYNFTKQHWQITLKPTPRLLTREPHKWYVLRFVHEAMEEDKNQNTWKDSKKIIFHHRWNANMYMSNKKKQDK